MPIEKRINEPPKDLSSYNILIGGPKKIGKTSLAAQFPEHHILECEPGNALHVRCSFTDIGNVKELERVLKEAENTDWVKTWVMDEFAAPYQWLLQQICKQEGVIDPSEIGSFGKGWGAISRAYVDIMTRFTALSGGKLFTTHADVSTIKTVTKREITKYKCQFGKGVLKNFVDPKIHNIWLLDYFNKNRVIIIQGDDYYEASSANLEDHFKTPNGRSVRMIPMGNSAKEGYENLLACFRNELELEEEYLVPIEQVTPVVKEVPKFKVSI